MNFSVTHAWMKGNFKSVFRINRTKMLIKFYCFILRKYDLESNKKHNQKWVAGCSGEKPRPKG